MGGAQIYASRIKGRGGVVLPSRGRKGYRTAMAWTGLNDRLGGVSIRMEEHRAVLDCAPCAHVFVLAL